MEKIQQEIVERADLPDNFSRTHLNNAAIAAKDENASVGSHYQVKPKPKHSHVYLVSYGNAPSDKHQLITRPIDPREVYFEPQLKHCNCTCFNGNRNGIACRHIFAVMIHLKCMDLVNDSNYIDMFFHPSYRLKHLTDAYSLFIDGAWPSSYSRDNT